MWKSWQHPLEVSGSLQLPPHVNLASRHISEKFFSMAIDTDQTNNIPHYPSMTKPDYVLVVVAI